MVLVRSVGELLDRIFCIGVSVLFAQFPLYIEQYVHVLSGALAEAKIAYDAIEMRAKLLLPPLEVKEFIAHLVQNEDPVVVASGKLHQEQVMRFEQYQIAFDNLAHCTIWNKPFVFFQNYEQSLIHALDFKPGLPFSLEGGVYMLVGAIFALTMTSTLRYIIRKIFPKNRGTA